MPEANGRHGQFAAPTAARRKTPWPLLVVAALLVIVPFIAWYGTWFGRTLSDEEIGRYLSDEAQPRHEQHALSQIVERMQKGDAAVRRWYPQLVALAASRHADVRMTAAWAMGRDTSSAEFHAALIRLLEDGEPIVRRNAALALVAFNDARARAPLIEMLHPYTFNAPLTGRVVSVLPAGTLVKREGMVARVSAEGEQLAEIRAPLPGRIGQIEAAPGAQLTAGQPLLQLVPDEDTVVSALVGLRFVGTSEDLPLIEHYRESKSRQYNEEATLTAAAIKRRMTQGGGNK